MESTIFYLLDKIFLIFHTLLIVINLFGWIWKPLRKLNLFLIFTTLFCWVVLGFWYGWGYCPVTDWHWWVLKKRGIIDLPSSYIKYLADNITGMNWNPRTMYAL